MDKHLHIVTLDIPWPADYGGVVDLFYKMVWLHKAGIKIHLHCFTSGRLAQEELDKYCESVNYYTRKKGLSAVSLPLPYMVSSRVNVDLEKNLQKDNHPVLLEGIHCSQLLYKGVLKNRKLLLRLHNVEFSYYRMLAAHEKNIFKKIYYYAESILLKQYEKKIARKASIITVSEDDATVYKKTFAANDIQFIPVFLPWHQVKWFEGKGSFCLYHGNLSVNENEKAAAWLITEVFNSLDIPLVIAGMNPSEQLEQLVHASKNCCLVANPVNEEMQDLIHKAQINILPSFNNTGVKLKLLNALYNGRFCLVNNAAIKGASLDYLCQMANTAGAFKETIVQLYDEPFLKETTENRQQALSTHYNNEKNVQQIINLLY